MPPTRRRLLQASVFGLAGSIVGSAGAREHRQDTEIATESVGRTTQQDEPLPFTVAVTTDAEHGVILTDAEGMTLYLFTNDSEGESTCTGDCAEAWPPLTVEESPSVPDGLPGEFDTIEREDGSMQVTYHGMALYHFANDEQPGDANGQGVDDTWFIVNPTCEGEVGPDADATTTEAETTTEDGGGGEDGEDGGPGY